MQTPNIILKIITLSGFFLLMGSLVAYRSGTFDAALGSSEHSALGDSVIPDSIPLKFIHSSKSMAPIFEKQPTIAPLDSFIVDSVKKADIIIAPSSKSGRVFDKEDIIIAPSSKSGAVIRKEDITPTKKKKKKKKKPMMSGSKSGAVISPQ